jgi:hypothetical protein
MINKIFYHTYCINDCLDRFKVTYDKIVDSGLIENIVSVNVIVSGPDYDNFSKSIKNLDKVSVFYSSNDNSEDATLNFLWKESFKEDFNCLYLHSKGVSHGENENIKSWVDYMEYFCIKKYKDCLKALKDFDICGVNLQHEPQDHYSGNFWWSKSGYLKTLINPVNFKTPLFSNRYKCEYWACSSDNKKCFELHQSDVDHYCNIYSPSKYEYD